MARRVHFLKANVGLTNRLIKGLTNLIVGTGLHPHAMTADHEWNHLAERAYKNRARSGLTFSVTGQFTGTQAQRVMTETMLTDGDAAVVFSKSEGGGALRGLFSGVCINNHRNANHPQPGWKDGILYDAQERPVAYRFPGEPDAQSFTDIPASAVRFLMRPDSPGQRRSPTILKHALNKIIDITELTTAWMKGIKASSDIGYYVASTDPARPVGGIPQALTGHTRTVTVPGAAGQPARKLTLKEVFGHGGTIPGLPYGAKIKQLLDLRPHPNSREFVEDLIRDICAGCGAISSDLLWNIYKLGGANVRYVLADAQVWISTEQQNLVDTWLAPDWVFTIACEMAAGRLRPCQDPDWTAHGWVPPPRVTVDFGRDGRILLDFHKYGLITTSRMYKLNGQIARDEITDELELVKYRKDEMSRLGLVPLDLQLYNPNMARITPEQPGEVDYAEQVPTEDKDDDAMTDPGSPEEREAAMRAEFTAELAELRGSSFLL